jgi:hypothetical protein
MEGMQIVTLVVFLVGLVGLDVAALWRGSDSRFKGEHKYEHPRTW